MLCLRKWRLTGCWTAAKKGVDQLLLSWLPARVFGNIPQALHHLGDDFPDGFSSLASSPAIATRVNDLLDGALGNEAAACRERLAQLAGEFFKPVSFADIEISVLDDIRIVARQLHCRPGQQ